MFRSLNFSKVSIELNRNTNQYRIPGNKHVSRSNPAAPAPCELSQRNNKKEREREREIERERERDRQREREREREREISCRYTILCKLSVRDRERRTKREREREREIYRHTRTERLEQYNGMRVSRDAAKQV